ncbi:p-hydroxybenzoic acid efflux pump subunit AaeB [Serratia quinivorans]|uniref:FUSC family protein n=1 Tax=Serratia quinivorans TaxID=137545 RepID=UPI0021793BF8|nr:FUSC family protein [Serratia quinivorans]CAI0709319.1 p-hydroxybenzoic acid efflux pump subunit AaeB [Serratia quinivorans]CAI0829947.1 p-hydroxybenzoic acid efflux pump subunit AaeB [Serratia quinivorans]CAI0906000.1 p-hydroxybenzoic acid efflux pump subunit AaeB [Serratia quinivorans]CAI0941220.1 p-hydroxybenzoic acid efflux pump subunit AaeB [Serratia quinivorans]CAI1585395.1 p-hydroxybenzoic acid efflux pump subunit AaeB [Serratia quinivorans]
MKVGKRQLLHAAKMFISAMLAFALAESIGLQNPYWAMVTCCVLSNPVSGAVRARATYRFCGTLFAGVLTLAISALLSNTPLLLIAAAGLSSSMMLGISYLDRTPRAYFFQLGAITMMLVAIAYINHPDTMFTMVVTRVTEICLGILAVTLVDSVLFPSSLAPVLRSRLKGWLSDLARWQEDSLDGKAGDAQTEADRIRLLSDIASFNQMMTTLGYDSSVDKSTRQAAISIQQRVLQIVPMLSSIGSSIAALPDSLQPALQPWLDEIRQQASKHTLNYARLNVLLPHDESLSPWEKLIVDELSEQIERWLTLWSEVQQLNAFLEGEPLPTALQAQMMRSRVFSPPPDTGIAVRMFAGILTTYILLCGLWYFTGWEQGANMVLMGIVAIAFFGAGDNPGVTIATFGRFAAIAMALGALLSYVLLPLAGDYGSFLIVMGLFLLPLGVWAATNPLATLAIALSLSNVNFQGHYAPNNMGLYLESTTATLIGVYFAFLCAALFQRWGTDQVVMRLMRQDAQEMLRINRHICEADLQRYQARGLDRISALGSRLASLGQVDRSPQLLARLKTGINLIRLQQACEFNNGAVRLPELLASFRQLSLAAETPSVLLSQIDAGLQQAWKQNDRRILRPLTRLRLLHFPTALHWNP